MLGSIILAFNVVFPISFMIAIGIIANKCKLVDEHSINVMNKLVFRIFMSPLIFLSIYNIKADNIFTAQNTNLILFCIVCVIFTVLVCNAVFSKIYKDKNISVVVVQGVFRSNLALFGIPVTVAICGEGNLDTISIIIATTIPLFNVLAVLVLGKACGKKPTVKKILMDIAKNPLVIASVLGIIFFTLKIHIPQFIINPLTSMSKVATPLAFVILGATLKFDSIKNNIKILTVVSLSRLVVVPAFVIFCACLLGFRGHYLVALLGTMASPTAVSSFTMVKETAGDAELAAEVVASTTIFSMITIFFWVLLLNSIGFI